jgi:hypothetical protein
METEEQVEISFSRIWDPSLKGKQSALNIDKRYLKYYFAILKTVQLKLSRSISYFFNISDAP